MGGPQINNETDHVLMHNLLLSQSNVRLQPLSRSFRLQGAEQTDSTPTQAHQWVDLCLIEVAHYTTTPSYENRHSCAAAVYCRRGSGFPRAGLAKKSLVHCLAGEVSGDVSSDGPTYARAHVRKPLQCTSGQGIRETAM